MEPKDDLHIVPIPIRPDLIVRVEVPWDLKDDEAEKIARVVMALAHIPEKSSN